MATLTLNTDDAIEFKNITANVSAKDAPFTIVQLGEWEVGRSTSSGIVIDAFGPEDNPPILSAQDARKLAKWLSRAADILDGVKDAPKKNKKRAHYEEDDEYQF